MEYIIFLLIVVVVYLLYLLNKKNDKPVNIAPIVNKREEKTKRVIIDAVSYTHLTLPTIYSV